MLKSLRSYLFYPFSTRARAVLSLVVLILVGFAAWQGYRLLSFKWHMDSGQKALTHFDFAKAAQQFNLCLEQKPKDPALLLLAAQANRRAGLLDKAEVFLSRYDMALGSSTPEGQLQLTLLRVQQGNVKKHVYSLLEELEIRHPASEQILEALAQGCIYNYRLDEASFWIKQLRDRFPDNPIGRLLDAQMLDTMRFRDRALLVMDQLVADFPENNNYLLYQAGLLFKTFKFEEAAQIYQELHRRQPEEINSLLGLISTLLKMERYQEVEPLVRELEEKHSDNGVALLECARFALSQKRPADAEPLLRRALQLAPNDYQIQLEMATCLEQLQHTEETRQYLEQFKKLEHDMKLLDQAFKATITTPADPAPRLEAGKICLRNGQVTEGLRWLAGVLDLVPDHKPTHQVLADYYESTGNRPLATYHRAKAQ